jgi:hypothetical protein
MIKNEFFDLRHELDFSKRELGSLIARFLSSLATRNWMRARERISF